MEPRHHDPVPRVRPAAVAGTFYPGDARTLREQVEACLRTVPPDTHEAPAHHPPKLLVVPHAGYVYSGDVAAHAYARLRPWRSHVSRVVLLGPVHRVPVMGLAAPEATAFETPLGHVALDTEMLARLDTLPQVQRSDRAHALEHSLEVQLPFLQAVLDDFRLVPLAVGTATPAEVAEVIEAAWGGDDTVIVVSTDLSHFLHDTQARARDATTIRHVLDLDLGIDPEEACGARPLNGALLVARRRGLVPHLLASCNSSAATGDTRRVVGYAAFAFDDRADGPAAERALGRSLLKAARNAIAESLGEPTAPEQPMDAWSQPGATFVTLHDARGALRGCIGTLEAHRPLIDDVRANARAAAFRDTRFAPLSAAEWPGLRIEVSVLDAPEPWPVRDEAEALAGLRPGVDGLVLEWRGHRATFLPQVWAQLRTPAEFLAALRRKAGLAPDFWADNLHLSRYRVRSFEDAPAAP